MKPRQKRDYYERDRDRRDKERSRRRSTSRHYGRKEDRFVFIFLNKGRLQKKWQRE